MSSKWVYSITNVFKKPSDKFQDELRESNVQLSQIAYKVKGFRALILLYFENFENLTKIYDELKDNFHEYHLHLDRMINAENLDELKRNNDKLLELRDSVLIKIHDIEKLLIETKLKNPKD